jgi:hypothetical protein
VKLDTLSAGVITSFLEEEINLLWLSNKKET